MLQKIDDVQCSAEDFRSQARVLSAEQAQTLITATLHREMAYSVELLPLDEARSLASEFISAAGPEATYFSSCAVADEVSGVGGWYFMVTTHTFESVLYCVGKRETALLVAIDED
jgi:ethanolamine ammonia-lyase large subunit